MIWEHIQERLQEAVAPKYEVQRIIGNGGMAGVYLAFQPSLNRHVAIKVMSPMLMSDPQLVSRFEQEARTIAQLRHGHIVGIHEVESRLDLHYFTMDYVAGRTLSQALKEAEEPLPIPPLKVWLTQIAEALDYAHRRGVIHRDIKPGNVLLDSEGQAHVTDFGIAKVADQVGLTQTGAWVGTPAYMSPEQCNGEEITGASDQYSLGCVMYELITGQPPFSGTTVGMIQAHIARPPTPIREARPTCPKDLARAVDRMLQKAPDKRWPTLSHMIMSLDRPDPSDETLHSELVALSGTVEGIHFEPELNSLTAGESRSIDSVIRSTDGTSLSGRRRVRWDSSDESVVQVSASGQLVAIAAGEAAVRASFGGHTATMRITVTPDQVGDLALTTQVGDAEALEEAGVARIVAPDMPVDVMRRSAWDALKERLGERPPSWVPIGAVLVLGLAAAVAVSRTGDPAVPEEPRVVGLGPAASPLPREPWALDLGDPLLWGATPGQGAELAVVASPPPPDPTTRLELEALLQRFGEAVEARDPANLAVDFLGGAPGGFLNAWAPLIADRQQLRGLSVASIDLSQLRTTPVRAAGTVRLVVTYQDPDGRPRQLTAIIRADFGWTEGAWHLTRFEEVTRSGS